MVKRGRDFEALIGRLESAACEAGAKVHRPHYVDDPQAGVRREIDVAVVAEDGTVLVALECRDRKRKGGLEWIEQVITKSKAIRARRTVAVSRSGFTKPARRRAEAARIELRSIDEVSDEDFRSWMPTITVTPFRYGFNLTGVALAPADSANNDLIRGEKVSALSLAFGPKPVTLQDLVRYAVLARARRSDPSARLEQIHDGQVLAYIFEGCGSKPQETRVIQLDFPEHDLSATVRGRQVVLRQVQLTFTVDLAVFQAAEAEYGKYVGNEGAIRGFLNALISPPGSDPDLGGVTISLAAPPKPKA